MNDILGRRTFNIYDQRCFATLSGDHNPLHLDPVVARRTMAGEPVVHGIHTLLWALEQARIALPHLPAPAVLRVDFQSFVTLGKPVELKAPADGGFLVVEAEGLPVLRGELRATAAAISSLPSLESEAIAPEISLALDLAEMVDKRGAVAFASGPEAAAAAFPATSAWIGAERVAALLACTRLVGMICPGLHSIFNRLDVALVETPAKGGQLDYAVTGVDVRIRRITLAVSGGGIAGTLTTSARHPPVVQPGLAALAAHVASDAFQGAKVLVIGGSRGLGEVCAKVLAAGGAEVVVSYTIGRDDAERVAGEIRAWGGACRLIPYDVTGDARAQLADDDSIDGLTHVYYFATPSIGSSRSGSFDRARLDRFHAFYVDGFAALCEVLAATGGEISVYYPSTVFVDERPAGMGEYAMAKAAGEILCEEIMRRHRRLRIVTTRLPRLATDQTATLIPVQGEPVADILLPLIRRVQSIPSPKSVVV